MRSHVRAVLCGAGLLGSLLSVSPLVAAPAASAALEHARIVEHWTPERRAAAIPRDLVIDERGLGYLRRPDGSLEPYGHTVAASARATPAPMAKPGGGDSTGPSVGGMDPGPDDTIGAAYAFKATVTDASGVRSVSIKVGRAGGRQQSFSATQSGDVWGVNLSGFTDGEWTWSVVAKDNANNTTTEGPVAFTVDTSTGGGGGGTSDGEVVVNARYPGTDALRNAVGRIYFEMPSNARRTRWAGYVCSGTVVADGGTSGRSIVQTAAHCVYDDANKAFARNVLFIPNQDATTGTGTDRNCDNDPLGCWSTAFGVVDVNWTTRTFPDNVAWDYAYYVVRDSGAHQGTAANAALDAAVTPIAISFALPEYEVAGSPVDYTRALGYSYSDDPFFMYCAEDLAELDSVNWWLGSCGLSGGSSGGPWMQPPSGQGAALISVNSWGYTNQPGMAGPKLFGTSASCVFGEAKTGEPTSTAEGDAGISKACP